MLRHLALIALTFCGPALPAAAAGAPPALEKLTITTASGPHTFDVEVMRTDQERERGLMFRRHMAQDRGMLFDFHTAAPVMMWMKNTFIPLDMIFIKADGHVLSTAERAEPQSERIIPSHGDALGVLEVNAGLVQAMGIKAGDPVTNGMFPR